MIDHKRLQQAISHCVGDTNLGWGSKQAGKVRDIYVAGDELVMVTTDRVSAFDRILGLIPYKGQLLNQLSSWWFDQTVDIVANHKRTIVAANAMRVRRAQMIPVEVVVRGYITGVTDTALWTLYAKGERQPYGVPLPEGLQKNAQLPQPIVTPTTKALYGQHDERLSEEQLIARGLVDRELWATIRSSALQLFARGQALARAGGLLLVDTKYEFGVIDGQAAVCDELHTPDSSRYWLAEPYETDGKVVDYSKEFLRKWYANQGYTGDGEPPIMPEAFRVQVAERYIAVWEMVTGRPFVPDYNAYAK